MKPNYQTTCLMSGIDAVDERCRIVPICDSGSSAANALLAFAERQLLAASGPLIAPEKR